MRRFWQVVASLWIVATLDTSVTWAQKPPPPVPPNPQAPVLAMPGPLGIQRGTTLELTLTGTNLAAYTTQANLPPHASLSSEHESPSSVGAEGWAIRGYYSLQLVLMPR